MAVLALGLAAAFDVAVDPADPAAGRRRCRAALIPPNTLHHLSCATGTMAFFYVDAQSLDLARLQGLIRDPGPRVGSSLWARRSWSRAWPGWREARQTGPPLVPAAFREMFGMEPSQLSGGRLIA